MSVYLSALQVDKVLRNTRLQEWRPGGKGPIFEVSSLWNEEPRE
jgi:hypothetical protein